MKKKFTYGRVLVQATNLFFELQFIRISLDLTQLRREGKKFTTDHTCATYNGYFPNTLFFIEKRRILTWVPMNQSKYSINMT